MSYNWFIYSKFSCPEVEAQVEAQVEIDGDLSTISDTGSRRRLRSSDYDHLDDEDVEEYEDDVPQMNPLQAGGAYPSLEASPASIQWVRSCVQDAFLQRLADDIAQTEGIQRESVKIFNFTEVVQDDYGPTLVLDARFDFGKGNGSVAYAVKDLLETQGVALFGKAFRDDYSVRTLVFQQIIDRRRPPPPPVAEHDHDHDSDTHDHADGTIVALLVTILVVLVAWASGGLFFLYVITYRRAKPAQAIGGSVQGVAHAI
ncbi:hypothetical protein CYMTET_21487 [Cymbomonas tetramitiformis]|uniref:Uncharacterized protein n=1 Tax=Cymbomonas tetramitiformis TaxID=36881 RepID=A0AAE0G2A6_9CHLO|nr:hypothetical protein CYMTET_21487 [Cymbomonas tetramitiformis]